MDTKEQMLSMLLDSAVETLDISPELQQLAIDRYEEVGTWLAEHGGYGCRIYPQGSFRLGTVVRPDNRTGEYDIDLVCWLLIAKENVTQDRLDRGGLGDVPGVEQLEVLDDLGEGSVQSLGSGLGGDVRAVLDRLRKGPALRTCFRSYWACLQGLGL